MMSGSRKSAMTPARASRSSVAAAIDADPSRTESWSGPAKRVRGA
jgi:hypothetical protein